VSTTDRSIQKIIDEHPIGTLQRLVVGLCFLLAIADGFDAQAIAYVAPVLAQEFSIRQDIMGQLISTALVGLMIGALVSSPLADRFGRKPVIVVSAAIMGVFSLTTATADSTVELFVYRFLTGLGLGGVMPSINILTAEFAPTPHRALMMTSMFVGFPIGTMVGGFAAAALLDAFGWPSIFILGGVIPLALLPFLIAYLPESPHLLASKGRQRELANVISRLTGETVSPNPLQETIAPVHAAGSIRALFSHGRANTTLLLWLTCFANLLMLYAIFGWLPSVLNQVGFPVEQAILISVVFSLGGVAGGLSIAGFMDRFGATKCMLAGYLGAALAVISLGQVTDSIALLLITVFLAGATVMGCQFGLNAIVSNAYTTSARATGLGWALAVGRTGAIVGPILVGAALALGQPVSRLFLIGCLPMLLAAAAIYLIGRLQHPSG